MIFYSSLIQCSFFQTENLRAELKEEKIQLLEKNISDLKKCIKVTDDLRKKLVYNHVLSEYEIKGFEVSYQLIFVICKQIYIISFN